MSAQDGGPAFPRPIGWNGYPSYPDHESSGEQPGMTLRDYFAGQAIAGYYSHCLAVSESEASLVAKTAYALADAMLRERARVTAPEKGEAPK